MSQTGLFKNHYFLKVFLCFFKLFFFPERCLTTTRVVHPPIFQGQLISFHLGVLNLSLQQETKKNNETTEMRRRKLHFNWWDSYVSPQVCIIKIVLGGEVLNIFLLTGISNINIFFKKTKIMWLLIATFMISLLKRSWLTMRKEMKKKRRRNK